MFFLKVYFLVITTIESITSASYQDYKYMKYLQSIGAGTRIAKHLIYVSAYILIIFCLNFEMSYLKVIWLIFE